jgi:hypothetical protein
MDAQPIHESGAAGDDRLIIANTVPIDPRVVELIEDRATKLSRELEKITVNLQERMASVRFSFCHTSLTPTPYPKGCLLTHNAVLRIDS